MIPRVHRRTPFLFFILLFVSIAHAQSEDISIGVVAPLTGDQAFIGVGMLQGAQMAVEDANLKGPVFGNSKLKLEALDDQHNPTQAVLAANKLASNPSVVAVVGHFNSSCTKAASSIYHESRLAQVTPASTNPEISRQGFDTFFRICPTDDVQAPAAALFTYQDLGLKRLAILDDQTTYGRGIADQFEAKFRSLGGVVLAHESITQGEKDFSPLLSKMKSKNPEAVFYGGVYPEFALLLKQAAKMGFKTQWVAGDGVHDATLIKLATPKNAEGIYTTMLGVDPRAIPTAVDFVNRYEARYGEVGSFSAYGYEAAHVLIEAIRRAGVADRESVLAQMKNLKDFPGILGPINFDERGDAVGKSIGVFRIEGGKFKFIKEMAS